ncbi:MAG: sigma-70 family RNA polymerase sigma factor, partial [Planctomycetes bacterium]|nr:sigma-70 family RNA polymerase sigma factor [Planctomycetota bacterium]
MTSKPTQIDIDAEFARFQRTRAPAALGRVFDVAAPQLLLVAMHFCGDAAAAEDLVQTVFLQVLRDADQHEVGRPVLPWLLAVLQHRASDQRTANARRTRREAAVAAAALAGVGSVTVDDPARHAIDEETRKQVAAALAGLPAGYREVLALRLVHGLRAVDIAHSLGQPPATVRTRLRRGLGLLRDALPRGLAAPALLAVLAREALAARDGLPAIRDRLLRALPAATTGALGVTAKWLLAAAAVAVLLTGAFAIEWRGDRTSPSVAGDAVVASGPLAAPAQDGGDRRNRPAPNAGERAAAPPSSKVAIESPDGQVLVHGRVVAAETDAPLAGVEVMV